jgi:cytochrome c5
MASVPRWIVSRIAALASALFLMACGDTAPDEDAQLREESCAVPAPTECPDPPPNFHDVEPVFEQYCNACHTVDDPQGPWPFDTYSHIVAWRAEVRDEVLNCTMPPAEGAPLPPDQRQLLMEWIFCGMPK